MTAIAGITDGKSIWIGADSAGMSGWGRMRRNDMKVFLNGSYIFGFTTASGWGSSCTTT